MNKEDIILEIARKQYKNVGYTGTENPMDLYYCGFKFGVQESVSIPNWTSITNPPKGEKTERLVLVRRSSDEILMGRCVKGNWIVYFNDARGVQSGTKELQHDPVIDWQELPITQQQFELLNP